MHTDYEYQYLQCIVMLSLVQYILRCVCVCMYYDNISMSHTASNNNKFYNNDTGGVNHKMALLFK